MESQAKIISNKDVQRSLTWKFNDLITETCFNHYYLNSILFQILFPLKVIFKENYFNHNCSQVCVEFSYMQLIFPSSSERKISKGPHHAPGEFSVLEISCVEMRISDAPFVGRAVYFPLNTTRLENCKPNGLKACSRHGRTGIQVEPLYGVQEGEEGCLGGCWSPSCAGLWLRSQQEEARSTWKHTMFPSKWGTNTGAVTQRLRFSLFFSIYRFRSEKTEEPSQFSKMMCFQIYSWEKALGPKQTVNVFHKLICRQDFSFLINCRLRKSIELKLVHSKFNTFEVNHHGLKKELEKLWLHINHVLSVNFLICGVSTGQILCFVATYGW